MLGLCCLPYRKLPKGEQEQVYIKSYRQGSIVVQPGYLIDPKTGKPINQGLPYGPKARLLLLHICTRALQQKSATVTMDETLTGFIQRNSH
jgi:hypothetical protein